MFIYEKKLQYPVRVSGKDVRMAQAVLNQYGGADGEMSASMNYLTQRFSMPLNETKGLLTEPKNLAIWKWLQHYSKS